MLPILYVDLRGSYLYDSFLKGGESVSNYTVLENFKISSKHLSLAPSSHESLDLASDLRGIETEI